MGGNAGGIIVREVIRVLSHPLIHGSIPADMRPELDRVLAKDPGALDDTDKEVLSVAIDWALHNL
jgi:hypothetical protein